MQQIYTARDDMDASFLQGLLEQEGITSVIQGEALEGAWGDLPVSARSLPSIWVNEPDVDRATQISEEYRRRQELHLRQGEAEDEKPRGATWKCPKCGEEVENQFDECWNCGTEKPDLDSPSSAGTPAGPN